jgi:hypothetical protein
LVRGLGIDDPVSDRTVFCIHRDRLLTEALACEFFGRVLAIAEWKKRVNAPVEVQAAPA